MLTVFAVFYGLDWVATVPPMVKLTAQHSGSASFTAEPLTRATLVRCRSQALLALSLRGRGDDAERLAHAAEFRLGFFF